MQIVTGEASVTENNLNEQFLQQRCSLAPFVRKNLFRLNTDSTSLQRQPGRSDFRQKLFA